MRVCTIEYGDFACAIRNFKDGTPATYRAQYYSLDYFLKLRERVETLNVINLTGEPGEEIVEGINVLRAPYRAKSGLSAITAAFDRFDPTHVILRAPHTAILKSAIERGIDVLPLLADSFPQPKGLVARARAWRRQTPLVNALNDPRVRLVSNHNRAATEDLARIGVDPAKLTPWDWPPEHQPSDYPPKSLNDLPPHKILYVGAVSAPKGVPDVVAAIAGSSYLKSNISLDIVGGGPAEAEIAEMIEAHGLEDTVKLCGKLPNADVLARMRDAALVVVPSRHSYPEGLPGTIYEALAMRTPIVMSDHPMFKKSFGDSNSVRFFAAEDTADLASNLQSVLANPAAYADASHATAAAFEEICCPVLWHEVIDTWLFGDAKN